MALKAANIQLKHYSPFPLIIRGMIIAVAMTKKFVLQVVHLQEELMFLACG